MFTGLIQQVGRITQLQQESTGLLLTIQTAYTALELGESIAVDGACLTVTSFAAGDFQCQLSPETCRLTIADNYQLGQLVNLERALCLQDRLGGHVVLGHVDTQLELARLNQQGEYFEYQFTGFSKAQAKLLVPKGSICINGVSLTINQVHKDFFSVMLIPHTLQATNLNNLKPGDDVNIEFDYLARIVAQQCQPMENAHV